jgi:hypothetical protein
MKHSILFIILNTIIVYCNANIFYNPSGAKATALGNQVSNTSDVFSVQNNPAGLGFVKDFGAGIFSERRFLVSGLDLLNASITLPTKTGTFGVSANLFGRKEYNEKMMGISFGKAFGSKFSAGMKFNYLNYAIQEYGQRNLFTFDVGFQYMPNKKVLIGAHIFNPVPIELEKVYDEKVATIMRLGFAYTPVKKLTLLAEIEKDLVFKPNIKLGVDYQIAEKFFLRGGFNSYPLRGTFGFGVHLKQFNLDAGASYHSFLGITPQLSLSYIFKKKAKQETSISTE